MLQNEEFMAELRRDTEFMTALEMEQERAASFAESSRQAGSSGLKTGSGKGATGEKKGIVCKLLKFTLTEKMFREINY